MCGRTWLSGYEEEREREKEKKKKKKEKEWKNQKKNIRVGVGLKKKKKKKKRKKKKGRWWLKGSEKERRWSQEGGWVWLDRDKSRKMGPKSLVFLQLCHYNLYPIIWKYQKLDFSFHPSKLKGWELNSKTYKQAIT